MAAGIESKNGKQPPLVYGPDCSLTDLCRIKLANIYTGLGVQLQDRSLPYPVGMHFEVDHREPEVRLGLLFSVEDYGDHQEILCEYLDAVKQNNGRLRIRMVPMSWNHQKVGLEPNFFESHLYGTNHSPVGDGNIINAVRKLASLCHQRINNINGCRNSAREAQQTVSVKDMDVPSASRPWEDQLDKTILPKPQEKTPPETEQD